VTLRPATGEDLAAIRRLHALSFAALAASHHAPEQIAAHERLIAAPDDADDVARSHLELAVLATGALVGSAGWLEMPDQPGTARIRKVFIHPDMACRGLATRLVTAAERRALAAGHTRLYVRANINAVPLYLRLGYRPLHTGEMATPDGVALPVQFMEKLPAA
jgi:putative acetyltransferase